MLIDELLEEDVLPVVSVINDYGGIHCLTVFLSPGLWPVVDHFLGSRPWSRPYIERADHAQWRPHTLCCSHPGEHTHMSLIALQGISGFYKVFKKSLTCVLHFLMLCMYPLCLTVFTYKLCVCV